MVSRSVFVNNNQKVFTKTQTCPMASSNLYIFEDIDQQKKDIVNSITLVWKANNFKQVDDIKNKLSFMVGVLRSMQQSNDFISKQIIKITQVKDIYQKKVKQKLLELNKDLSINFQEFKVKEIFQEFYEIADQLLRDIQIYKVLEKFYKKCVNTNQYQQDNDQHNWESSFFNDYVIPIKKVESSTIKRRVFLKKIDSRTDDDLTFRGTQSIQNPKNEDQHILQKTTLTAQKKVSRLPKILQDQRIHNLYENALVINDTSLQDILTKQKTPNSINSHSSIQTIGFLKANNIGVSVYPFNLRKYYNLYTLQKLPSWPVIKKFNTRIFKPDGNLIKQIYSFSKFKRINSLNQKLKYIILQGIIKEVDVYIYYLDCVKRPQIKFNQVRHFKLDEDDDGDQDESDLRESEDEQNQRTEGSAFGFSEADQLRDSFYEQASKFNLLLKFINKPYSLNQIMNEQMSFTSISQILKLVIQKMDKKKQKEKQRQKQKQKQIKRNKLLNIPKNKFQQNMKNSRKSITSEKQIDHLTLPKWGFFYVQKSLKN